MHFPEAIQLRTEPGLREALHKVARRENTTAAEFLRRELRAILRKHGESAVNDNGASQPAALASGAAS